MGIDEFLDLARERRSVRHFLEDPVPPERLRALLEAARWAPSGYNLQPTRLVVVTDRTDRTALVEACFGQAQVREAPVVVVFTGDRRAAAESLERCVALDLEAGAIDARYAAVLRRGVPRDFSTAPLGLGRLWKAATAPVRGLFGPVATVPAVDLRYWLTKQVMLACMQFLLAATAAGLATAPIEGFDERRVRRALGIPRSQIVPIVVPLGKAADAPAPKSRRPLSEIVHRERW